MELWLKCFFIYKISRKVPSYLEYENALAPHKINLIPIDIKTTVSSTCLSYNRLPMDYTHGK